MASTPQRGLRLPKKPQVRWQKRRDRDELRLTYQQSFWYLITIVATLGGLLSGYDSGVINGALGPMLHDFGLTHTPEGYVTSTVLIGAAIGAVLCGRINDALGRPPRHGDRRTSLQPHPITWYGSR